MSTALIGPQSLLAALRSSGFHSLARLVIPRDSPGSWLQLAELTAGRDHLPVDAVPADDAVVVNREIGGEAAGAVTVMSVGEALIRLLEPLDVERGKAHPRGGDQFRLARREPQAPDRERIRRGRPLEVDIGAAGNLLKTLTVTRPVPLTVRRQAEPALTAVLELDLDVASAPAGIDLDPIANDIGRFLMGLQNQTGQLEPITRGSHDQALHAGR